MNLGFHCVNLFKELILRKILLVVLGLLVSNAYADDGSSEMKAEAKVLIQGQGISAIRSTAYIPLNSAVHLTSSAMMYMSTQSRIAAVAGLLKSTIEGRIWQ